MKTDNSLLTKKKTLVCTLFCQFNWISVRFLVQTSVKFYRDGCKLKLHMSCVFRPCSMLKSNLKPFNCMLTMF